MKYNNTAAPSTKLFKKQPPHTYSYIREYWAIKASNEASFCRLDALLSLLKKFGTLSNEKREAILQTTFIRYIR